MKSIEMYLNGIYTELEKNLSKMDCLCEMKSLNYQSANLPNYHNLAIQQLYLLKYAYAYTYEYYHMYRQAMNNLEITNSLSVVSVGCGALIDYNSLKALKEMRDFEVRYTGIDKVNWSYKPVKNREDQWNLQVEMAADEYFCTINQMDADIYVFPKSISELSFHEVNTIAECFQKKENKKERFCICVSLRNTPGKREEDIRKINQIGTMVTKSGYKAGCDNHTYVIKTEDKGIKAFENNYNYPKRVLDELKHLENRCKEKSQCRFSTQCESCLNRNPMLKTGGICYKIMTFERGVAA